MFSDTWPPDVAARLEKLWRQAREQLKDDPVALQRFEYWNWTFELFIKEARVNWAKAGGNEIQNSEFRIQGPKPLECRRSSF